MLTPPGGRAAPDPTVVDFALTPDTQTEALGSAIRAGEAQDDPLPSKANFPTRCLEECHLKRFVTPLSPSSFHVLFP
jgi:hypothetical protein